MISQLQQSQLWQNFKNLPPPKSEESIALRVLVQLLVIVGIMATDVAAGTMMSAWAIPLSIVGGIWSWYHRKKQNITSKFLLAIAMIVVMLSFFSGLFANFQDSRLILAQLLIQLQVIHSFDLPRRKDLGYSIVIGLILLGVAGTVSQTLAFAPLLLVFLALALPTLVLDYRSRLGLDANNVYLAQSNKKVNPLAKLSSTPLSPQRLGLFLLITLLLGLFIFAIMPRFGGFKLQSFPVSSPIELADEDFNMSNQGIVNPGYTQEGEDENGGGGQGNSPTEGPGQVSVDFYYGFNSKINQNLRGTMIPKMVMRVRSQAPGFWRVVAFDHYTGQGWEISREEQLIELRRPRISYRFPIPLFSNLSLANTRDIIQSYTIVSDLPNLIPTLAYPKYLFYPTEKVAIDLEGSLRSPVYLMKDLTYTVISQVPYRDRTILGQASENYGQNIKKYYLQIPPEIKDKVRVAAENLLAKSSREITSPYEKALYLAQAIKQNYTINPNLPFFEEDEDLVEAFLFRYEGGYADHFATVYTIMLRSLGIPARLVAGFAPGQFNPFTGFYIVNNTDAYALTEVYFPQYGWFTFDPIPGHEIIPPSFEQEQTFGVIGQFWRWIASWLPSPITDFLSNLVNIITKNVLWFIMKLWGFFSNSLIGLFVGLLFLIALSFIGWLGVNQTFIWLDKVRLSKLPPMERLYQQMLRFLGDRGYPKHSAQTPLEYAHIAYEHHQGPIAEIITEICQAYVGWRYGEKMPNINYLEKQLMALKRSMKRLSVQ